MYPGVWRHGDWIRITERGSAVIEGRSDSTLNRQGIRFGTSELYGVVEGMPGDRRQPGHRARAARRRATGCRCSWSSPTASTLDDALAARIRTAIREALSQRHVPDDDHRRPGRPADADRQEDGGPRQAAVPGPGPRRGRGAGRDGRSGRARMVRRIRRGTGRRGGVAGILPRWTHSTRQRLVVALDGPGSSGKSSVGAAAALEVGYRFCDTGLLYRAVTWLALARSVSASYPHASRGLVDEVELAPDADGPPGARARRRHRPHRRRPQPGRRRGGVGRVGHPGAARRAARAPARARRGRRDRHGRPRHRDGRPARRRPQDLPRGVGRGAGAAADRGARARPDGPGGDGHPRRAPAARRARLDPRRRAAAAGRRTRGSSRPTATASRTRSTPSSTPSATPRRAAPPTASADAELSDAGDMSRRRAEPIDELDHAAHPRPDLRRPGLRPGHEPGPARGRDRRDPARRAGHPRRQPRLEPRRGRHRRVADAEARPADPLARQEGAVRLADRRLDGGATAASIPVDRGAADVEAFRLAKRILDEGNILFVFPEGTRSPDGALQEAAGRRRGARHCGPAPRSCRSASPARTASGPRARSCRTRAAT